MVAGKGNAGGFSKTDLNGEDLTGPGFAWDYPNAGPLGETYTGGFRGLT
jgi:hypothetical protein